MFMIFGTNRPGRSPTRWRNLLFVLGNFSGCRPGSATDNRACGRARCSTRGTCHRRSHCTSRHRAHHGSRRHPADVIAHIARAVGVKLGLVLIEDIDNGGRVFDSRNRDQDLSFADRFVVVSRLRFGEATLREDVRIRALGLIGELDDDLDITGRNCQFFKSPHGFIRIFAI